MYSSSLRDTFCAGKVTSLAMLKNPNTMVTPYGLAGGTGHLFCR